MGADSTDTEAGTNPSFFEELVMDAVKNIQLGHDGNFDISAMDIGNASQADIAVILNIGANLLQSQIVKERHTYDEMVGGTAYKIAKLMGAIQK